MPQYPTDRITTELGVNESRPSNAPLRVVIDKRNIADPIANIEFGQYPTDMSELNENVASPAPLHLIIEKDNSESRVLHVGDGFEYATLEKALDVSKKIVTADNPVNIFVHPGIYYPSQQIIMVENVYIYGIGNPTLYAPANLTDSTPFILTAKNSGIYGVNIINGVSRTSIGNMNSDNSVAVSDIENFVVKGCSIKGTGTASSWCILGKNVTGCIFENNSLESPNPFDIGGNVIGNIVRNNKCSYNAINANGTCYALLDMESQTGVPTFICHDNIIESNTYICNYPVINTFFNYCMAIRGYGNRVINNVVMLTCGSENSIVGGHVLLNIFDAAYDPSNNVVEPNIVANNYFAINNISGIPGDNSNIAVQFDSKFDTEFENNTFVSRHNGQWFPLKAIMTTTDKSGRIIVRNNGVTIESDAQVDLTAGSLLELKTKKHQMILNDTSALTAGNIRGLLGGGTTGIGYKFDRFARICNVKTIAKSSAASGDLTVELYKDDQLQSLGTKISATGVAAVFSEETKPDLVISNLGWNVYADPSHVTVVEDEFDSIINSPSAKFMLTTPAIAETLAVNAINIPGDGILSYERIQMFIKSSIELNAGDLKIAIYNSFETPDPVEYLDIPIIVANKWILVDLPLTAAMKLLSPETLAIKQAVDKGAFNFKLDGVKIYTSGLNFQPNDLFSIKEICGAGDGLSWSEIATVVEYQELQ